jgi:hypothetical protein
MSYTDQEIDGVIEVLQRMFDNDEYGAKRLAVAIIRQLLAQRDDAVNVAEAYQKDCDRANAMLEETRASRASAQSRISELEVFKEALQRIVDADVRRDEALMGGDRVEELVASDNLWSAIEFASVVLSSPQKEGE